MVPIEAEHWQECLSTFPFSMLALLWLPRFSSLSSSVSVMCYYRFTSQLVILHASFNLSHIPFLFYLFLSHSVCGFPPTPPNHFPPWKHESWFADCAASEYTNKKTALAWHLSHKWNCTLCHSLSRVSQKKSSFVGLFESRTGLDLCCI